MNKISLEEVEATLQRQKVEPAKVTAILKDLNQILEELQNEKDKTPKEKWEYVVVLNDKDSGWVVQQKEGEDAGALLTKLNDAARDQNEAASKKKSMLNSMADIFDGIKSKYLKSKNVRIKTKELVRVIVTK
jgi:hypothetical protein